jgi:hypothetical protein
MNLNTNVIQYLNVNPVSSFLVSVSSRYAGSQVIYYGVNNYMTFSTYTRTTYTPSQKDKYAVIPPGMEYRPDKVSQQSYGVPDFWYRIMEANNMSDIMQFKSGTNIVIPASPM